MPWFKVDDGFWGHPKRLACPMSAIGLWVAAGSWSSQQLTDGHVPRHVLTTLGGKPKDAAALVTAGLWTTTRDGWRFHDWHDMQPTRAATLDRRAEDAERKRQARAARAAARASRPQNVREESERTPSGRPENVRPESALPDPTRPDPTRTTSVVETGSELGSRRVQQRETHDDDPARALLDEHEHAVGPLSAGTRRSLLEHVTAGLDRTDPDSMRDALRRYRDRAATGQRTLPGLLPRLVDDVLAERAGDDPLAHPDAQAWLATQTTGTAP